jgi:tetratricopeptide (TPR) repeat protein
VLAVLMFMTFSRNRVYTNDLTLWQANYAEVPNSIRAVFNLGGAYSDSYPARAAELYKRCIALDPSYAPAYVRLAMLFQIKDKAREVEELVKRGLDAPTPEVNTPGFDNPLRTRSDLTMALGISKGFQGLHKEAEDLLLQAIELYPANSQAYDVLASYYHESDHAKEIELLKRQVGIFSDSSYALQVLSTRLIEDKRYDEAVLYLERILTMLPNDFYANYQLGQIYRTKNECDRSGRYLTAAKQAASGPEDVRAIDQAFAQLQQQCAGS